MRWHVLAAAIAGLAAFGTPAAAAPTVKVKARTLIELDPIRRSAFGGIVIRGHLVDRFSKEPVPWVSLDIQVDYESYRVLTNDDGSFERTFDVDYGTHDLLIAFAGDSQYTAAELELRGFDVEKESLRLSVAVEGGADYADDSVRFVLRAWSDSGGLAVPLELYGGDAGDDLERLDAVTTDEDGSHVAAIPTTALGAPGRKRVEVHFAGNTGFNAAAAGTDFLLTTPTEIAFTLEDDELEYEAKLAGRGRVTDARGGGVADGPVALIAGHRRLAEALTDESGYFSFRVAASELGEGKFNLRISFEPTKPWRTGASAVANVQIAEPEPVPVSHTIAAFAATALALVAFVALRTRPWQRWTARSRGDDDEDDDDGSGQRPAIRHGLREARPGLVSTLRRASDAGFAGTVRDAANGKVLAGATLRLDHPDVGRKTTESGAGGEFAFEDLEHGAWSVRVAAEGYCTEAFTVGIPHRGELRGARIDLLPVRERIFEIYQGAAQDLLPRAELWGVWSPREIFEYVRASEPAPALSELTDFVEEAYFSQRTPTEAVIPEAERLARAAAEENPRRRAATADESGPNPIPDDPRRPD